MRTLMTKFYTFKHACANVCCAKVFKRNYLANTAQQTLASKIHPYKQMHPWKSLEQFSEDLLNNIIYNEDGLVVLNKPYGIKRTGSYKSDSNYWNNVPNGVYYTLQDALPYIRDKLNYPNLSIFRSPEMYMSGATLLAADFSVEEAVQTAFARSHFHSNTYWIVTVGVPKQLKNRHRLALKLISNPEFDQKKVVLTEKWSKWDEVHNKIKILKVDYNVLSNSTLNLCSLIEMKASTENRHAIRLFASTYLYCPVLGDNIFASQIQKVGNTYLKVDPFLTHPAPPKLDRKLLQLLDVNPKQQTIMPAHIHLRSVFLPSLFKKDVTIEAPLMPAFDWTCKQLEFKYFMQDNLPAL